MKKQLLLIVMMLLPMVANAYDIVVDGIYYNIVTKARTAEVTYGDEKYIGNISIPSEFEYEGNVYSVNSIGEKAFFGCWKLVEVNIPSSIIALGNNVFSECTGLKNVIIPQSVVSIGRSCFTCSGIKEINIPENVKSLGFAAFAGCGNLEKVYVDGYIENIDMNVFSACDHLKSVHIKDISKWCMNTFGDDLSNPLYFAHHLFINGEEITELTIPKTVGESVQGFAYCTGLKSVVIPNYITTIKHNAFFGCTGIEFVDFPQSLISIEGGAFAYCSSLTSISIPNSVTHIGGAFAGCTNLSMVSIGKSVSEINSGAFANCKNLSDIYCFALNVPNTANDAFENSYIEYSTLHVPSESVNAYKAAEPWKIFKEIVAIDGETPETPKCEKPTIIYANGQLNFASTTDDVEFISEITDSDIKKNYEATVTLTATYNISVYTTKTGYDNSDVATATLCWIDKEPTTEGITNGIAQISSKAVLIQSEGGMISLQGVDDGTQISAYTADGVLAGSTISRNGGALLNTNLRPGTTVIMKIGEKSIKVVIH